MGGLSALKHKPPNLEKILEIYQRQAGPDAVGAECAEVLKVDLNIRAPTGSRGTAHTHHNHTFWQIDRLKLS